LGIESGIASKPACGFNAPNVLSGFEAMPLSIPKRNVQGA
jgi:hypothetical protein